MAFKLTLGHVEVKYNSDWRHWCVHSPERMVDYFCNDLALIELGGETDKRLILDRQNDRALIDANHLVHFPSAKILARTHGPEVRFGS